MQRLSFYTIIFQPKCNQIYRKLKYAFTYLARTTRTDEYGIKLLEVIKRDGTDINFSTVTGAFQTIENQENSYAKLLSYDTDGINIDNISYENVVSKCIEHIYDQKPANVYKAIIGTGYKTVLLNRPISMQYEWYRGGYLDELTDDDDIDKDGLYDYQEILFRACSESLHLPPKML